ncbi:MAG: LamG domain-containing protein [Candidatus Micrarchaeales archaeon]
MPGKQNRKVQSAMEYLMTYGWAFLIIAIVITALYQLGVFNGLTPKASPGTCQVYRPNGANSTQLISLTGICNAEEPQFVATFPGTSLAYIANIPDAGFPYGTNAVSIFAWVKSSQSASSPFIFQYGVSGTAGEDWILGDYNGAASADLWSGSKSGGTISNGNWNFVGFTFSGGSGASGLVIYVNGVAVYTGGTAITPNVHVGTGSTVSIGFGSSNYYLGSMANVQIYNTSLSANEIQAMYIEGIGGQPIRLQNLVGWWPLNANANDYSGDNLNGIPTNVGYTNSWTSGYSTP